MLTRAIGRFLRVSPSKARLITNLIRGKSVEEALSILQYSPQAAARLIEKLLRSAIANAEHNHQVRSFEGLRVGAVVDGGPSLKRIQPRAMGRAFWIRHRTSHITILLSEPPNGQPQIPEAAPRRGRRATGARGAAKGIAAPPATRPGKRAAGGGGTKRPPKTKGTRSA